MNPARGTRPPSPAQATDPGTLHSVRRGLLWVWGISHVGLGAELLLTGHTEGFWQRLPLFVIALSLVLMGAMLVCRLRPVVRLFQLTMILCALSGGIGLVQHYRAKMEFKLELDPSLAGWSLFWQSVKGSAVPPVLAPGVMISLGILGWLHVWRHPSLTKSSRRFEMPSATT